MYTKLSIPERLKDLRVVDKHLTLEQLAEQTGLSKSALGKYESDDYKDISPFAIATLAKFYGVSTDYLMGVSENKNHPNTELQALHLSDAMVELLSSGKINNRLLCELATHPNFLRLMVDMEIFILPVMGLGISTFVMLSTESLLSISFSSSLARYGGDVAVGAMTVITSVSQLCTLPIQGICQGGQPVMSFNFGAGKKPRVKEEFRFQLTLCFGYTTLFWLLMMLVPGVVAGIFTSDAALIEYTTWAMRIYMAGILAMGVQIACQQSFMALGQAKVSLLLACLRKIILLIPLIFILPCFTADKCLGVFLAEPVSDILAATITAITFFSRFDKILDKGAGKV